MLIIYQCVWFAKRSKIKNKQAYFVLLSTCTNFVHKRRNMSFIVKHIIASNKGKFILFLICIYIAVATAVLPYGILPSLAISTMAPLLVLMIAYPTYYILLPRFLGDHKKTADKYYFIILSLLLIMAVMTFVWICLSVLYNVFDIPRDGFTGRYSESSSLSIAYDGIHLRFLNPSSYLLTYIFTCIFYAHDRHHKGMNKMLADNQELEMKILKSQINSHFLHNALNNIYSIDRKSTRLNSSH